MPETYTIGDIAAAHDEKVRTVQFWADSGVIKPIEGTGRKGKGSSRLFDESEMRFAGLAKRLAAMNSPVGEICDVIEAIRSMDPWMLPTTIREEVEHLQRDAEESLSGNGNLTRYETINRCLSLMSKAALCSAKTDIELIISYFREEGEVKTRILFFPRTPQENTYQVAPAALHGFIGFKAMTLNPDRDIWIKQKLDAESLKIMEQAHLLAIRFSKRIFDVFRASQQTAEA